MEISSIWGLWIPEFTKKGFLEHSKNFRSEDMQARIERKNCVVTGANSGIVYATAEGLAARGATVYIVCRSKERDEAARSKIQSATGNKNVHLEEVRWRWRERRKFCAPRCRGATTEEG